jgi:hypothetical protein
MQTYEEGDHPGASLRDSFWPRVSIFAVKTLIYGIKIVHHCSLFQVTGLDSIMSTPGRPHATQQPVTHLHDYLYLSRVRRSLLLWLTGTAQAGWQDQNCNLSLPLHTFM